LGVERLTGSESSPILLQKRIACPAFPCLEWLHRIRKDAGNKASSTCSVQYRAVEGGDGGS